MPRHEPPPIRRAAMMIRIDAQRAMKAMDAADVPLQEVEARPPHERAIAENPQIARLSHHCARFSDKITRKANAIPGRRPNPGRGLQFMPPRARSATWLSRDGAAAGASTSP